MEEKEQEQFKANLLALIKLFDNAPNIIVNYLIEHNAFTSSFQERVLLNKTLTGLTNVEDPKPPFFRTQEEMMDYYNDLFKYNSQVKLDPVAIPFKNENECLQSQLDKALQEENYEEAAHIRDYAKEMQIKLQVS